MEDWHQKAAMEIADSIRGISEGGEEYVNVIAKEFAKRIAKHDPAAQ